MNKIMGLLTVARRAGRLRLGMDMTKDACRCGEARCVAAADDISQKSLKEVKFVCSRYKVPLYSLGMTMDEVGADLGKRAGIIAVCDNGFYKKIDTVLEKIDTEDTHKD